MIMSKKSIQISSILAAIIILLIVAVHLISSNYNRRYTPRDYAEIEQDGTMYIAVNYSPLSYHVDGDSISGFDYELLQLLSRYTPIEIDIHPEASLSQSLELLRNRTYDVVAQQIPITSENKQEYIFTKPLLLNKQVLIQRIDSTGSAAIRNQLDLGGCTLHIAQDAPTRLRIENLAHEIGDTIYICEMPDYGAEQLIILVATGEIEYAVCDEAQAAAIATDYDNIDYRTDISFTQLMSWTLRQESVALRDSIDKWLSIIQEGEEYKNLYTRYFGKNIYNKHKRINEIQQIDTLENAE